MQRYLAIAELLSYNNACCASKRPCPCIHWGEVKHLIKRYASGRRVQPRPFQGGLWVLALSFLLGTGLGVVSSGQLSMETSDALQQYLQAYIELNPQADVGVLPTMLELYLRYPVLAFALGFLALGVVLIPLLSGVFGFFLSFCVCTLVVTFGQNGVWIGLCLFGLRSVVSVVCYFLVAVNAWNGALRRFQGAGGYTQGDWLQGGFCLGCLLLGIYLDYMLSPDLLAWALTQWL